MLFLLDGGVLQVTNTPTARTCVLVTSSAVSKIHGPLMLCSSLIVLSSIVMPNGDDLSYLSSNIALAVWLTYVLSAFASTNKLLCPNSSVL